MSFSTKEQLDHAARFGYDDGAGQRLRADMVAALLEYERNGRPLGGYLMAIVTNDLFAAVARADRGNRDSIAAAVAFVHNELSGRCHGSPQAYKRWIGEKARERIAKGEPA